MTDPTTRDTENVDPLDTDDPWLILEKHEVLSRLEPDQVSALIPLARGLRISEVAAKINRGASTIYRWSSSDENFKRAIKLTIGYIYQYGLKTCAIASGVAANTLLSIAQNKESKDSDRVRAAVAILEYGNRWKQQIDLESRVEELERLLAETAENGDQESIRKEIN